jgi:hypothetical protein
MSVFNLGYDFPPPLLFLLVALGHSLLLLSCISFYLIVLPHYWLLVDLLQKTQIQTSGSNSFMFWSVISPTFRRAGRFIRLHICFAHLHTRLVCIFLLILLYIWTYIKIMERPNCFGSYPPPLNSNTWLNTKFPRGTHLYSTFWLMFY